jgi:hypothetical protein
MSLVACPKCEKLLTPDEIGERTCSCGHPLPLAPPPRFEELDPEPPLVRLQWSAIGWAMCLGMIGAVLGGGAAVVCGVTTGDSRQTMAVAVFAGLLCGGPAIALPFFFRRTPAIVATGIHLSYVCGVLIAILMAGFKYGRWIFE